MALASSSPLARSILPRFLRPHCLNLRCSYSSVLVTPAKFEVEQGPNAKISFLKFGSIADNEENKEKSVKPRSVSVKEAYELLQSGQYRFLDVRTLDEFKAERYPTTSINIPYYHIFVNAGKGEKLKNLNFMEEVSSKLGKDEKILVGCKLGIRSLMAAADMLNAGYTDVTDVAGGITDWKKEGLPTTTTTTTTTTE